MIHVYAIVGLGANDQETPALIFPTIKDAKDKLKEHGLIPDQWGKYMNSDTQADSCCTEHRKLMKNFYKSYYGGCGEIYAFVIRRVRFGKTFATHNLD